MNWLVRKWRQWFGGHYKIGDYVYTRAELEAAFGVSNSALAERAAEARRDYDEFMRRISVDHENDRG